MISQQGVTGYHEIFRCFASMSWSTDIFDEVICLFGSPNFTFAQASTFDQRTPIKLFNKKLTLPGKSWKPISPTLSFSLLFHVYSHRPVKTNGLDEESAGCLGGNGNQNGGVSCGWVRRYLFCLKNSATILQLETRTTQTCCEKMVNVFQVHDIF